MGATLELDGLSVDLSARGGPVRAVERASLRIAPGETVCLVGESGSGKTVTALATMRLIEFQGGRVAEGSIALEGRDLATLSQREMSTLRGRRIGMVFQEPMTAFDPLFNIGAQIAEVIVRHRGFSRRAALVEAVALLRRVKMPEPEARAHQHPHQLSGGMRQRAMVAMALACDPTLLIADEPTTALDVTIQAQILMLLRDLQAETGMAILLITHDLGIAAEVADRVAVMYAGRIVEEAPVEALFATPAHPYTRGLLRSVVGGGARDAPLYSIGGAIPSLRDPPSGCRFHPRCPRSTARCMVESPALKTSGAGRVACWEPHLEPLARERRVDSFAGPAPRAASPTRPLVEAIDLRKTFPLGRTRLLGANPTVRAVDGVSLRIEVGETLGLVGESGCGKSTLARMLLGLERPTSGSVWFDGQDIMRLDARAMRRLRPRMQMVFQDPYGSIDPRWTIGEIVAEPLAVHDATSAPRRRERVQALLEQVGLDPAWHLRFPHQLSGGQRQRVAIARALAPRPDFILADEAVSALDVSVQAQIINLLQNLGRTLGLTYLFIGHGLNVVRQVSDRIAVMYLGRVVEVGPADAVFRAPAHHYTKALIAAIPEPDPRRRRDFVPVAGEIPSAANPPSGCRFHTRCPAATPRCRDEAPAMTELSPRRFAACHFPL